MVSGDVIHHDDHVTPLQRNNLYIGHAEFVYDHSVVIPVQRHHLHIGTEFTHTHGSSEHAISASHVAIETYTANWKQAVVWKKTIKLRI